ncbi:MAG: hypothetical protein AAF614_09720 [Chloroflexota bacterium]
MTQKDSSTTDQILDLLLDALLERQQARQQTAVSDDEFFDLPKEKPMVTQSEVEPVEAVLDAPMPEAADEKQLADDEMPIKAALWEEEDEEEETAVSSPAEPLPTIYLEKMLARLFVAIFLLTIVVNIPFNRHGTNLARAMPDEAALVIRNGLLLKGSSDKVYVLQDNKRRWITSLDAFTYFGYRWENVHEVDDAFLQEFEEGQPIHLLQKCASSPHVYALENDQKRWIKDIPTFEAQGYRWQDVQVVPTCSRLRQIPDGLPIPEDAGDPPRP